MYTHSNPETGQIQAAYGRGLRFLLRKRPSQNGSLLPGKQPVCATPAGSSPKGRAIDPGCRSEPRPDRCVPDLSRFPVDER
jgi:hypothetical protein